MPQGQWKTIPFERRMFAAMEDSFTTLFKKPPNAPAELHREPKSKRGYNVSIVFLPIYLPLLLIAWAVSIPWSRVRRIMVRRRERRFSQQMWPAGRTTPWEDFECALNEKRGTAIGEYLSLKGPFRLWWTPDNVPILGPHKCDIGSHHAWLEPEFMPFFDWCREEYTDTETGTASLVSVPDDKRIRLKDRLSDAPFVSICSFKQKLKNLENPAKS
jgi:hypothetical protein